MAVLSDSSLLLNHIKNCFIYGDDTGICEMIIDKELRSCFDLEMVLNNKFSVDIADTSSAQFRCHSPEISIADTKPSFSRKLSSDVRIMEVEEEKALIPDNHKFIDTGQWPKNLDENEIEEFFSITKDIPTINRAPKSLLSKMLEETDQSDTVSPNIFSNYARFSAVSYSKSINPVNKSIDIKSMLIPDSDPNKILKDFNVYFWDFDSQRNRLNPIVIRPLAETKVSDFIGLACWKYTDETRQPPITDKSLVNRFQLYMFEDNDDLELDFGCLHREDSIYKYQFSNLAIRECTTASRRKLSTSSIVTVDSSFVTHSHMEKFALQPYSFTDADVGLDRVSTSNSSDYSDDSILIQVQLAHGVSKLRLPPDTTVDQIIQRTIAKRQLQQHGSAYKYRLELASDPGRELDHDKTLSDIADPSFVLIRDMSRRKPAIPDCISEESSELLQNMIDFLLPQKYTVHLKQTLRRSEATLMVSGDLIEIDVHVKKVPFLIKPKIVRIPVSFIADCIIDSHGQSDTDVDRKATVKLVHLKRKSVIVKSLKSSGEYNPGSGMDSESSSNKSHARLDFNLSTMSINTANLASELTSHSVSCQWSKAKVIYDQIMIIINMKSCLIRREYLKLAKQCPL